MGCEHAEGGFCRPPRPKQTAFYHFVEKFYPRFEERYHEFIRLHHWSIIQMLAVE